MPAVPPVRLYRNGRPDPGVVIELRRRAAGLSFADRTPKLAVPGLGDEHFADFAGANPLDRFTDNRRAAALCADLEQFS